MKTSRSNASARSCRRSRSSSSKRTGKKRHQVATLAADARQHQRYVIDLSCRSARRKYVIAQMEVMYRSRPARKNTGAAPLERPHPAGHGYINRGRQAHRRGADFEANNNLHRPSSDNKEEVQRVASNREEGELMGAAAKKTMPPAIIAGNQPRPGLEKDHARRDDAARMGLNAYAVVKSKLESQSNVRERKLEGT